MGISRAVAAIVIAVGLGGCASVVSGTSQTLTLDTIPSGADCSLSKKGLVIGRVNPTPGGVYVQRTRDDITVECKKDGYQTGSFINRSGLEAATLGNVILGGLVGVIVDSASGANNKYDEKMRITLAPLDPDTAGAAVNAGGAAQQAPAPTSAFQPGKVASDFSATVEFHCPGAGTDIRTSVHSEFKFTNSNGLHCGYTDESGQARERYALFADGYGRLAKKDLDGLWPLKVGNTVSFDVIDGSSVQPSDKYGTPSYHETFAVTDRQRVTVTAGTFDTFVVEWREQGISNTSGNEALITLWYAPAVGYVVKSSVRLVTKNEVNPYGGVQYQNMDYEATEIAMANGQLVPVVSGGFETRGKPGLPKAPASVPASIPASGSPADRLKALNDLRDQKLITPEEYESRRKAILGEL